MQKIEVEFKDYSDEEEGDEPLANDVHPEQQTAPVNVDTTQAASADKRDPSPKKLMNAPGQVFQELRKERKKQRDEARQAL